jgi:transposase
MKLNNNQYQEIADCFPRQRGNVSMDNLSVLNAFLYVAENGCKWRRLPSNFGNWHTVYTRIFRWANAGVLDRVFAKLQQKQIIAIKVEVLSLDSTSVKVHPDGTGAKKKTDPKPLECLAADVIPKFIWLPQMSGLR